MDNKTVSHLEHQTVDGTQLNLDALYQICPSCFTETKGEDGQLKHVINFEKLRALLGDNAVEDAPEVYDFTWVGKRAALREAMAPCRKTLRPCPEESVDWDTTKNLYIEGDNLEVLKLLQNSYMGKVKMIYIDPPYNTGNDFVYHDDFKQSIEEFDESNRDEDGNRYRKNTDSNGRFHSDWCSMMYSRLMVARSLLTEDGLLFISIGDEEIDNLRKIADEVFGEYNFRNQIVIRRGAKSVQAQFETWEKLGKDYENILLYSKCNTYKFPQQVRETEDINPPTWNNHWRGTDRPTMRYPLLGIVPSSGQWRWSKERSDTAVSNYSRLQDELNNQNPSDLEVDNWVKKQGKNIDLLRLSANGKPEHFIASNNETLLNSSWMDLLVGSSSEICKLFDTKVFDTAKLSQIIVRMLKFCPSNSTILDFFSGSATTAHAVMQLNAEDGGNRKFIMVQLPEETANDSEAYKAGYKNICEIGKERIRRAGKKIKEEHPEAKDLDVGFRVFKCDESNYKEVALAPKDYDQGQLELLVDNIKDGRSDLDLLFDCMLRWGVTLDLPMSKTEVDGCTIHNVNDGGLVACFDGKVTERVIEAIAEMYPAKVVFRDSSFEEAAQKMNLFEMFKQKCNWTDQEVRNNIKVI